MTTAHSPHRGHVAAGDVRTADAGRQILAAGGNAVDAAVGAVFAAFVAEPVLTGPFGGGFGFWWQALNWHRWRMIFSPPYSGAWPRPSPGRARA